MKQLSSSFYLTKWSDILNRETTTILLWFIYFHKYLHIEEADLNLFQIKIKALIAVSSFYH